ncbi:MAG: hypothetical protein ACK4V2_05515 [Pseudomonadota bacterium]|jgi:hypothetical protein|nr:hypothetical protein [Alphaproteobacteria bacterium]
MFIFYQLIFLFLNQILHAATLINESTLDSSRFPQIPPSWQERHDIFDAERDLKALFKKSHVSGILPITNNTNASVSIRVSGKTEAFGEIEEVDITLNPSEITTATFYSYENVQVNTTSLGFINLTFTDHFELSIENSPALLFPRVLGNFSFIPPKKSNTEAMSSAIQQYFGATDFLRDFILRFEEIRPADFFAQRERLYAKYCLQELLKFPFPVDPRIPFNIFNIWLTDEETPRELDPFSLEIIKHNSRIHPRSEGWNYYLLVQNPDLLLGTKAALEETDIQIISYIELIGSLELIAEFNSAIAQKNFGRASDILRTEALKRGGFYLDNDLQVFHSLKPYCYLYDGIFGIQPMDEYLGNAFMACSPDHPIVSTLINLIKRNYELLRNPDTFKSLSLNQQDRVKRYYANTSNDQKANTVHITGPSALTVAFYKAAEIGGKINIALPPEAIFPGKTSVRPTNEIPIPGDPLSINSLCVHYWTKTWL